MIRPNYIRPDWPVPPNIKAVTTTRRIQSSAPTPYEHFNLATHVDDDPHQVQHNRQQLQEELQLPEAPMWLTQVHGNRIIELKETMDTTDFTADASFTKCKNKICAILTADCLPLLIYDAEQEQVAAIHGGWRGLHAGIITHTVKALKTSPASLLVWLGPAISAENYAVGEEIFEKFLKLDKQFSHAFLKKQGQWLLDLYKIATIQLMNAGIKKIYSENFCTYRQTDLFYSYRRDGQHSGRMATLIYRE